MKLRVLILLAIAASAACHREPGKAPVAPLKPRTGVSKAPAVGPTPQELTAGMVEAVTQGRSQAPVLLKFDLLQRPVEGQPLEVGIALLPQIAAHLATVAVSGSEGLKLEDGDQQFQFPTVEAAQVYRHRIKVTPSADGLYLLNLAVNLQHDQSSDSQVFSVPILVGNAGNTAAVRSSPPAGTPAGTPAAAAAQQKGPTPHRGS
jgi:hypothetical protein